MKRRNFLLGVGGASVGGSALVGSGAFSKTESQRQVTIDIAEDPQAYLGLDECPNSANNSFVDLDEDGHLEVEMAPGNPTDGGGEGVNSDSLSHFDEVFQICNNGKQEVCVWIDAEVLKDPDTNQPLVDFYVLDGGEERSILGVEQAVSLPVGECICVGIRTYTRMLSAGQQLVENNEVVVNADADLDCPTVEEPPEEPPSNGQAISWIAFCGSNLYPEDFTVNVDQTNDDGEPTRVSWYGPSVSNVVVFGAARLYNTSGSPVELGDGTEVEWGRNTEQRPPSPCPNGECGPKWDSGTRGWDDHQDECKDDD